MKIRFEVGSIVYKTGGRYQGPGLVVGKTLALGADGYVLYNVAMKVEGGTGWFVHVFPGTGLHFLPSDHPRYESLVLYRCQLQTYGANREMLGIPDSV